jgi:hypothetical protein
MSTAVLLRRSITLVITFAVASQGAIAGPRAYDHRVHQLIAEAVPAEVGQVASGGYWVAGGMQGTYRAIVVQIHPPVGSAALYVRSVYVQWIKEPVPERPVAIGKDAPIPEIVNTTEIKLPVGSVVSTIKLSHLEKPSAMVLTVETDRGDRKTRTNFALGPPGVYTPIELDTDTP